MNLLVSLGVGLLTLSSPGSVHVIRDIAYAPGTRGKLDVYAPKHLKQGSPVVVFLYGGSWQSGERALYKFVGVSLASKGIVTIIPDYRLYPEVRYPEFLSDNATAVAFAYRHAADWGGDPSRLFLVGHSAGAYNAAMLALDKRWLAARQMDPSRDIKGVVGLAGPYDFLPLRDDKLKIIFGPEETRPDTQPINHVDGRGPPMTLLAGDKDTVVDPGNSSRLAAAIAARGGIVSTRIYPGLGHVSLVTSLAGMFRRRAPVLNDVATFITGQTAPVSTPSARGAAATPQTAGA